MITAILNDETIAYINKEWTYEDGTKVDLEPNRVHKAVGINTTGMILKPYEPTSSITDTLIDLITRVEKLERELHDKDEIIRITATDTLNKAVAQCKKELNDSIRHRQYTYDGK